MVGSHAARFGRAHESESPTPERSRTRHQQCTTFNESQSQRGATHHLISAHEKEHANMIKYLFLTIVTAIGLLSTTASVRVRPAAPSQVDGPKNFVPPRVFQAAGPNAASIQSTVDAFRAALGTPNNGNAAGPLGGGRREINWDGGNVNNQTTAVAGNPFAGFQITRGALFTTPDGDGFVQAPASADPVLFPPGGMAGLFHNPTYATTFAAFSQQRLFSALGGRITDVAFFVPGGNGPATTTGFGAVFTDVDQPDGSGPGKKHGNRGASTRIEYFDDEGKELFSSFVPASPGNASQSFLGIVFDDARIAAVRITSGDDAPGPDDGEKDIVMMDDFIYGELQPLP